jgi:hypothetical protein
MHHMVAVHVNAEGDSQSNSAALRSDNYRRAFKYAKLELAVPDELW